MIAYFDRRGIGHGATVSSKSASPLPRGQHHGARFRRVAFKPIATSAHLNANGTTATGTTTLNKRQYTDANFPVDAEGRTYHLGTKRGEVANRVLSVGSTDRAIMISKFLSPLQPGKPLFQLVSKRGFLTVTGSFNGTPVSIISTMMGMPNMDFVVRENRAIVDGQMAVVRLGTCGAVQPPAALGALLLASGSVCVRRDPDAFNSDRSDETPYSVTKPIAADSELTAALQQAASELVGESNVVLGLNASADSFYSSQGRMGAHFDDRNEGLIPELVGSHPDLVSLEMETFHLYDLARCSRGSLKAAAFCIALAERYSNAFIEPALMEDRERSGGLVALTALSSIELSQ